MSFSAPHPSVGESPTAPAFPTTLAAGVVAHNDEARIERSVRSLLEQQLPAGTAWGQIWLVASGCTDRTVEIAEALAREDPRVHLLVESQRRGKAAAIQEVLRRARGDAVVLLNSDAVARPGAISALLHKGEDKSRPYAVMGRPVLPGPGRGGWGETMGWMWDLHHAYHLELLADGRGTHLCDELLLLSGPAFPPLPSGVINDGSYLAVWLGRHGGRCWYAPEALVEIDAPRTRAEHLRQRRRIHVGNAQVATLLGSAPATLPRHFWRHPISTSRTLVRMAMRPGGPRHLSRVLTGEIAAHSLALWDRIPPAKDHVRWTRIGAVAHPSESGPTRPLVPAVRPNGPDPFDRRISTLLEVAARFGAGVPLDELVALLPREAPTTASELAAWLRRHPEIGRVADGVAFARGASQLEIGERQRRAAEYLGLAHSLVRNQLAPVAHWLRTVAVSGSTAYGAPEKGDDLDLFVVTRSGALWAFLAYAYLVLRLKVRTASGGLAPRICLNYVLDDRSAPAEFAQPRDFLFAREALTARTVLGDRYYRGLLGASSWIELEIPRLYAERAVQSPPPIPETAPWTVRAFNVLAFLAVAPYLQLAGLWRNRTLARQGRSNDTFGTRTSFRRLGFTSRTFELLRALEGRSGTIARPEPPEPYQPPVDESRATGATGRRISDAH